MYRVSLQHFSLHTEWPNYFLVTPRPHCLTDDGKMMECCGMDISLTIVVEWEETGLLGISQVVQTKVLPHSLLWLTLIYSSKNPKNVPGT